MMRHCAIIRHIFTAGGFVGTMTLWQSGFLFSCIGDIIDDGGQLNAANCSVEGVGLEEDITVYNAMVHIHHCFREATRAGFLGTITPRLVLLGRTSIMGYLVRSGSCYG